LHCLGFLLGGTVMVLLSAIYFQFTNKDIISFEKLRKKKAPHMLRSIAPGRNMADFKTVKTGIQTWRVDTYLTESLRPRLVRSVTHYESSMLLSVFRQNHLNALVVQLFGLIILIALGFVIDQPYFRIPAGASVFILSSVCVAITGAVTYWFGKWRLTIVILLLVFINFLTSYDLFQHKNKAYGLNYQNELATYTYAALDSICTDENIVADKKISQQILDNWHQKRVQATGTKKPKMVIFCVSGGGMKAAVWSMQVLQQADQLMRGELFKHCTLITGASGGLIGTAYLRELYLRQQQGEDINIYDRKYIDNVSKDLLNSLTFTIVSNDLFMPWVTFETGGHTYYKDRGYIFEKQLSENTKGVFQKTIADYRTPELSADIPMLFLTPSIVNDGRRLVISPHPVSYMGRAPVTEKQRSVLEIDAVDFGRMFGDQGAYDMRFTTALRMNATYPYILPNVYLPSSPSIEVMDAGFRDNYGIMSSTRFIHVFKDWIQENTSGVVLIQISGTDKYQEIEPTDNDGMIESLLNPLGIAGQIMTLQDYEHDTNLGYVFDLLGEDMFEVIRFIYHPSKDNEHASMTFHLTSREKNDILKAFDLPKNQQSLKKLLKVMGVEGK